MKKVMTQKILLRKQFQGCKFISKGDLNKILKVLLGA